MRRCVERKARARDRITAGGRPHRRTADLFVRIAPPKRQEKAV